MSNYPDGMRESDIPGFNDVDLNEPAKCDAKDVEFTIFTADARENLEQLQKAFYKMLEAPKDNIHLHFALVEMWFKYLHDSLSDTFTMDCPFDVDEWDKIGDKASKYWQCPMCGKEHIEEYDFPEPDEPFWD